MLKLHQDSENLFVTLSSFLYSILGIFLFINQHSLFFGVVFFLIGISAFFHHSYPKNQLFRILDWSASVVIILALTINYEFSWVVFIASLALLSIWYISFHSFQKHNIFIYTLTHTLWHICSVVFIFWLIVH